MAGSPFGTLVFLSVIIRFVGSLILAVVLSRSLGMLLALGVEFSRDLIVASWRSSFITVSTFDVEKKRTVPNFQGPYGPYFPSYTSAVFSIFLKISRIS